MSKNGQKSLILGSRAQNGRFQPSQTVKIGSQPVGSGVTFGSEGAKTAILGSKWPKMTKNRPKIADFRVKIGSIRTPFSY